MSGLELTPDQLAIQADFDGRKQAWKDRYLTEFRRLLQTKESFRVAVCGHANTYRNETRWEPETVQELDAVLSTFSRIEIDHPGQPSLSRALAEGGAFGEWNANLDGVAWRMTSTRVSGFMQGDPNAQQEVLRGLGLPQEVVGAMRICDILAYETARFQAGFAMGHDFYTYWFAPIIVNYPNEEVFIKLCQDNFAKELNAAMQAIVLEDLYEQASCIALLAEHALPARESFQIADPGALQGLTQALTAMRRYSSAPLNRVQRIEHAQYTFASARLRQILNQQNLNPVQKLLQPIGRQLLNLIEEEEQRLRGPRVPPEYAAAQRAKLVVALNATHEAISNPSAESARACLAATQGFKNYSSKQKKGWAIACVVLLSLLAVGIVVGVAMTGALPALAVLAPIGDALIAGCVTAGLTGVAATGTAAKGAHVAFSKSPMQKQGAEVVKIQEGATAAA